MKFEDHYSELLKIESDDDEEDEDFDDDEEDEDFDDDE